MELQARETLPEKIDRLTRAWPHWSPAERENIDSITWDVIEYMSDGRGGGFIREFCETYLIPELRRT